MHTDINEIFQLQKAHCLSLRTTDASVRKDKLRKLKSIIKNNEGLIFEALQRDLRKSEFEAAIAEVYFIYTEIDFAIKNLSLWMKPRRVRASLSGLITKNRIYYEPKGISLILAPWNYPVQLMLAPLVSAIAAGNCAILKPSEISAASSSLINKLISENFDKQEIACFEGDVAVSEKLLKLPFDHIFFTGSTAVGRIIMAAAARHLSSVTLELGGKSPVIIAEDADLDKAAEKIAWGKFMNAGQTCIAPDYILVRAHQQEEFTQLIIKHIDRLYQSNTQIDKYSYGKIVNSRHYARLIALRDQAISEGAIMVKVGSDDENDLTIAPTVLTGVLQASAIMQEEIFGPLLPIISYTSMNEAISLINEKPKPLALYVFSASNSTVQNIIRRTSAGGTCINDVVLHISNPYLPFGGIGSSGNGSSHGFFGFKAFSHERGIMFQSRLDLTKLVYPPYRDKYGLLKWIKKIM